MMNTSPEEDRGTPASASNDAVSRRNGETELAVPRAEQLTELKPPSAGPRAHAMAATKVVPLSLRESERALLRPIVAQIENGIAALQVQWNASGFAEDSPVLVAHWRNLVEVMALGTPPELRVCPHCGYHINAVATRCIQCWKMSDRAQPSLP